MSTLNTIWQQTNRKTLALSVVIALILISGAHTANQTLAEKAKQQQSALSQIKHWKAEYELLKPYQAQWDKKLTPTNEIKDLYHVYTTLDLQRYGLTTNQEHLIIDRIEPVTPNGTPINAIRSCLKTASDNGLSVTASRFSPDLLNGLERLADRRDVEIQNIQLTTENGAPKAVMDFCLIFRA